MTDWIAERPNNLVHLKEGARPAMRDQQRHGTRSLAFNMDKVQAEAVNDGLELWKTVQQAFLCAPVVGIAPVDNQLLEIVQVRPIVPASTGYLKQLVVYWRDAYDWRTQERLLNRFPQFQATIDGFRLHFLHIKGKGPHPMPLIISHGWPGSFFEMYKIIGPLSDPVSHGGLEQDAFDVVVPSLPGYGFSQRPDERGMNVARIAELFMHLMRDELGYQRFGAQGGDWGSSITSRLGYAYPQHLIGIHLNMVPSWVASQERDSLGDSPELQRWRAQLQHYQQDEGAYSRIQGTRPQTLAYGLNDSPAGLAGWIVEKLRACSDCHGDVQRAFTKDELLTNIMIYWVTQPINSSTRLYYYAAHMHGP